MKRPRHTAVLAAGAALVLVGVSAAAPGDLDPSFGGDGVVSTAIGTDDDTAQAVVVQPDGKLVAAGWTLRSSDRDYFALARYKPDGSLDASFGGDGIVTTPISFHDRAHALALQPDGKLVAAGSNGPNFALLARYNPDGSLDTSFSGDGIVFTAFEGGRSAFYGLAVQGDGKLVAAGFSERHNTSAFALARYNADGNLDSSFGDDGIVKTPVGPESEARAVAVDDDGKIVAAGAASRHRGEQTDFALARYNPDGSLDTSFGVNGLVVTPMSDRADVSEALALQEDGKLVAAGWSDKKRKRSPSRDFALARYNADGSLDPSFGSGGKVVTDFGDLDRAFAVAVQPDGKIVAAGSSHKRDQRETSTFALARYDADGSLDTSFGVDGTVRGPVGFAYALVLQADGKLVGAGAGTAGTNLDFALAHYSG